MDLNLLIALDALLDEGGVGAAADRLHLSQPAMSRTLGRIRKATGDPILVRSGREMLPTPYAERIRDEVHQIVTRAQTVLTPTTRIDPAALDRTFTLQCNDVVADALLTRLAARLTATAPGVRLRFLGEAVTTVDELRRGHVDFQITDTAPPHAETRSATVLTDTLAVAGHHDLPRDPSTWEGFAALPHIVVSRRGRVHDRIDDLLDRRGLRRRVAFTVPTLALALRTMTVAADLITVAPRTLAGPALPPASRLYPLPAPTPAVPAVLAWHARHDRDPAHGWMRELITRTLTGVGEGRVTPSGTSPDEAE
ncbi:LysR family transcriptional regulator [Streptomyces sp. PTM05]|uniref:LysR family transcriptional regulator n=1 Tax=Streptantibioticus parmotrematis TaxID=2873249 RepID=A0ABS7QUI0_9ACTN|nr:LysR family transcriptional regulator [Streptantibioticus parmotrematis]MBY8885449.1 LysR family transcriptional regulator [Streptantibioticus parmotrematis]